ncbi:hypothetical protein V6N13_101308 [Hibiscus sabdariffa]
MDVVDAQPIQYVMPEATAEPFTTRPATPPAQADAQPSSPATSEAHHNPVATHASVPAALEQQPPHAQTTDAPPTYQSNLRQQLHRVEARQL